MAKVAFDVYEWKIENFSSWDAEVHGHSIYGPELVLRYVFEIFLSPRGSSGQDKQMKVFLNLKTAVAVLPLGGNLSIIDPDGSLLCTKQTDGKWDNWISTGLKFEEVAAKIKNNGDRLILRLCLSSERDHAVTVSTTLDVLNLSMRIDSKSIESLESGDSKNISIIRYYEKNELLLKAIRKGETIEFILELLTKPANAISVESQWSLQNTDKTVGRNEENKFLFHYCEPWKFSNPMNWREWVQNGITMLLNLKIINGDKIHNKLKAPQEITAVSKGTVCFFDQSPIKNKDSSSSKKTVDSVAVLTKDFMCLYQDQDFSDLQLKCENVTFPVHRAILSARSPVFKTMLSTDMQEAASGTVDIGDLDPSTLSRFLTYLYTGAVEEELQSERAIKLYYAADKYQVPSLKSECSVFLCDYVSIENVCDILSLADKHKDDELTAVSHDFVVNNYSEVLESEQWAKFMEEDPLLAVKTVTHFAQKKYVGKIQ